MNESTAREILLMQSIESADTGFEVLSAHDRISITRAARELVAGRSTAGDAKAASLLFLRERAALVARRILERHPAFAACARPRPMRWLYLVPLLAFITGAAIDRVAHPHRIDMLSVPLLGIIAWNLVVYVLLLVRLLGAGKIQEGLLARRMAAALAAMRPASTRLPHPLVSSAAAFGAAWQRVTARLAGARIACLLHCSALLFTAGAIASLYLRGLFTQYLVGWESTFLDAQQVHDVMAALFRPATTLFGLEGFNLPEIAGLHFGSPVAPTAGSHWVHLYGATLVILVVAPRGVLALVAGMRAQWLARRVGIDLAAPYFVRLCSAANISSEAVLVRVLPYSFHLDEQQDRALAAVAERMFGDRTQVMVRPVTGYGQPAPDLARDGKALTVLLFNLTATPEHDAHGAFVAQVQKQLTEAPRLCVDISALAARMGVASTSDARLAGRCEVWRRFADVYRLPVSFIDLAAPERTDLP